jgi:hypothetical protein
MKYKVGDIVQVKTLLQMSREYEFSLTGNFLQIDAGKTYLM